MSSVTTMCMRINLILGCRWSWPFDVFSMGASLSVKPADGWLAQRPQSPDAYLPPECESGHMTL